MGTLNQSLNQSQNLYLVLVRYIHASIRDNYAP